MSWHKKDEAPGPPPTKRGAKTKGSPKADAMRRARLDAQRGDQDDAGEAAPMAMMAQRFGGGSPFKAK